MREMKFRGKDIETDEWLYGFLIGKDVIVGDVVDWDSEYFCTEFWRKVDPETVGQFVHVDAYTGDIFHVICDCDSEYGCNHNPEYYELIFHEQYLQYGFRRGSKFVLLDEFDERNIHSVGNIHDNSELLTA